MPDPIDRESPEGAWRAALNPDAVCAVPNCRQTHCDHTDLEFQGLVPEVNRSERA